MKVAAPTTPVVSTEKSDRLKSLAPDSLEREKKRLKEATKQFEAFFTYYMLKTMRETIPKSGLEEDLPLGGSDGQETFTDMFDMEIAKAGTGGARSISDLLYRSLEKLVETRYKSEHTDGNNDAVTALPKMLPLRQHKVQLKPLQSTPIQITPEHKDALPISPKQELSPHRPAKSDPIVEKFGDHIEAAARATQLDSTLIASVIRAESGGDPTAVSPAGAKGLMQLADTTAQDYGVNNVFDPAENILAGSRFLKSLVDRFQDLKLALAAYNAGPGNVAKYGGIPPFKETRDYVTRVTNYASQRSSGVSVAKGTPEDADNKTQNPTRGQ